MYLAVFTGHAETVILKAKNDNPQRPEDIEGYHDYFTNGGRDVTEYDIQLAKVGGDSGVVVTAEIKTSVDWGGQDLDHIFPEYMEHESE